MAENIRPRFSSVEGERPAIARNLTDEEWKRVSRYVNSILEKRRTYSNPRQQRRYEEGLILQILNADGSSALYTRRTAGKLVRVAREEHP